MVEISEADDENTRNKTEIHLSSISRYFNPESYNENNQSMSFLSVQYDTPIISPGIKNVQKYRVMQNQITYFNFPWIQLSMVSLLYDVTSFKLFTYNVDSSNSYIDTWPEDATVFEAAFL